VVVLAEPHMPEAAVPEELFIIINFQWRPAELLVIQWERAAQQVHLTVVLLEAMDLTVLLAI
jgi:hypothetical protein